MRKKTEAKRQNILLAAQQVFREQGYQNASMNEIAARVGGSKATLYSYFSSKAEIFTEVVRDMASQSGSDVKSCVEYHQIHDPMLTGIPEEKHEEITALLEGLLSAKTPINDRLKTFGMKLMQLICSEEFLAFFRLVVSEAERSAVGALFYENGPNEGLRRIAKFLSDAMQCGMLRQANPDVAAAQLLALMKAEIFEAYLFCWQAPFDEADFEAKVERAVDAFMRIYKKD